MKKFFQWLLGLFGGGQSSPKGFFVVIDPGHGGKFSGAAVPDPRNPGREIHEKNLTLQIALKLGKTLEKKGKKVSYTRDHDQELADEINADLRQRAEFANATGAEVFVSIHCNAADNEDASGFEVYFYPGSQPGEQLANQIHRQLALNLPTRVDRGVKSQNFAVLRLTTMPSCLVETEFMTNAESLQFLLGEGNQHKIADAIARGLEAYFRGQG